MIRIPGSEARRQRHTRAAVRPNHLRVPAYPHRPIPIDSHPACIWNTSTIGRRRRLVPTQRYLGDRAPNLRRKPGIVLPIHRYCKSMRDIGNRAAAQRYPVVAQDRDRITPGKIRYPRTAQTVDSDPQRILEPPAGVVRHRRPHIAQLLYVGARRDRLPN